MNKAQFVSAALAGAAVALISVVNCGSPMDGDPIDGRDGAAPIDSAEAQPDALAATVSSFSCDQTYVYTYTYPGSSSTTITTYYADVSLPGVSEDSDLSVTLCDSQCHGASCMPYVCPSGYTCSQSGTPPAQLQCSTSGGSFGGGRLVVWCGWRTQIDYVDPSIADIDQGLRHMRGHVLVR